MTSPAFANPEHVAILRGLKSIDVPLLVRDVDMAHATDTLWVRGAAPANLELARFSAIPVQAATLTGPEVEAYPGPLWRAVIRGSETIETTADLTLDKGPVYFCGKVSAGLPPYVCLVDENRDGKFDARSTGFLEAGIEPYRITRVAQAQALAQPLSYRLLPEAELPKIDIRLTNCARDYDRPRYSATSTIGASLRIIETPAFSDHMKDSSLNQCRRAAAGTSRAPANFAAPEGGFVTELGPLVFAIGPKRQPQLIMGGISRPDRLYRMEASSLVELSVGPTPAQAEMIAQQEYPYPMLVAHDGGKVNSGSVATGQIIATVPFRPSYMGTLTSEVVISTLFSKRAIPAGTMVYGFPARSSTSATLNGTPVYERILESKYRSFQLELLWCAPIKDDVPDKSLLQSDSRSGWRASCLPRNNFGGHTIIGSLPAFNVTSLGFDPRSASNPGPPPVRRDDSLLFAKPLRLDYVYDGNEGETIRIRQNISYGDDLTSSKVIPIYAPDGKVSVTIAGAEIDLKTKGELGVEVTVSSQPKADFDPELKWDNSALLLKQLRALGISPRTEEQPVRN